MTFDNRVTSFHEVWEKRRVAMTSVGLLMTPLTLVGTFVFSMGVLGVNAFASAWLVSTMLNVLVVVFMLCVNRL